MTKADIIAELEKRLGQLDEKTKQAIEMAVELAEQPAVLPPEPKWQGENPPFEEMAKLDIDTRSHIMQELQERNRQWLERKLQELGARWILVMDGKVLMHSPNMQGYLTDEEFLDLCSKTGKVPLLYLKLRPIEERVAWHPTVYRNDAYPTIPLRVSNGGVSWETAADFDTGALDVHLDANTLEKQGLISNHLVKSPWLS